MEKDLDQLEELVIGTNRMSGQGLREQAWQAAHGLIALGVEPEDRVAILMRNDLAQLQATLAAQRLGAYPVQINWHGTGDEIAYVLGDCRPRVLIAHADLLARIPASALSGIITIAAAPSAEVRQAYGLAPADGAIPGLDWHGWLDAQPVHPPPARAATDSIIYTSGTTGHPKGVKRFVPTDEQRARTERMRFLITGIDGEARVMVPAPLYHTAPNLIALRALRQARSLVLPTRFDPEAFLADVERHGITHVYAVPTMFSRLLKLPEPVRNRYDLSSLRFVLHAGGPCAPGIKTAMLQWWGPVIHEYYGSTEAGPNTFCRGEEWLARPGTVGRAIEGVRIEVRDAAGAPLPDGEIGELHVFNDNYPDFTYLNRPDERQALQRGELLASGDVGYRDRDGYYFLCDRKRDLVISGGVNIYPAEIESVLLDFHGVADCAVFGIPDEEFGERVAAFVEPHAGQALDLADLRAFLAGRLATFKIPRLIEIRDHLPRDEAGKIRKRYLREPYWENAQRKI